MRSPFGRLLAVAAYALAGLAQEPATIADSAPFLLEPGTRLPLSLINTVSTRNAAPGDRVYLETVFPILSEGRIVVPPGSYVAGTVTQVKRAGRVKGRSELFVRFDSLTLPNGVTRDFRGTLGAIDGSTNQKLDREEGKIKGDSNKGADARTVGQTTQAGAGVGALGGWAAGGRPGLGLGVGSVAGAAAGLAAVLMTRGPDAMLAKGTTVEMVLDRQLSFTEQELAFGTPVRGARAGSANGAGNANGTRLPISRATQD